MQRAKEVLERIEEDREIRDEYVVTPYKQVGDITLDVLLKLPKGHQPTDSRPALAFFHGGGWECGKPEWGHGLCSHFADLGMVTASFEYRISTQHGATPIDGVQDARSAIRWLRQHSGEYGIDPDRIVASGYSAGGHLAACTAMCRLPEEEPSDDPQLRSTPDALILWVTPLRTQGFYFSGIGRLPSDLDEAIDPASNVRPSLPPGIAFQGTGDHMVSFEDTVEVAERMKATGNRLDLHLYEGLGHFDWSAKTDDVFQKMDAFLASIGMLDATGAPHEAPADR